VANTQSDEQFGNEYLADEHEISIKHSKTNWKMIRSAIILIVIVVVSVIAFWFWQQSQYRSLMQPQRTSFFTDDVLQEPQQEQTVGIENALLDCKTNQEFDESLCSGALQTKDLLEKERLLLTQKDASTQAYSPLFGFKLHSFDPDWDCNNSTMRFDRNQVSVGCYQKSCQDKTDLGTKDRAAEPSTACINETENRRIPVSSLGSFTMTVENESAGWAMGYTDSNLEPLRQVFRANRITPNAVKYAFETPTIEPDGYGNIQTMYQFIFYSPKKMSNLFASYNGEAYSDDVGTARYVIEMSTIMPESKQTVVDEKVIISLAEKMIDSIEFTDPINK
jgi:hypothetical protein